MSKYIDEAYVKAYPIRTDHYDEEHGNLHFIFGIESVMEYIDSAPSIDIVRCGDCKYSEITSSPIIALWCKRFGLKDMAVEADDFCSYGEREMSDEID